MTSTIQFPSDPGPLYLLRNRNRLDTYDGSAWGHVNSSPLWSLSRSPKWTTIEYSLTWSPTKNGNTFGGGGTCLFNECNCVFFSFLHVVKTKERWFKNILIKSPWKAALAGEFNNTLFLPWSIAAQTKEKNFFKERKAPCRVRFWSGVTTRYFLCSSHSGRIWILQQHSGSKSSESI